MAEKLVGQIEELIFKPVGDGELAKFTVGNITVSTFQPDLVTTLHGMKDGDVIEADWKESEKPGKFGNKFKNLVSICLRADESKIPQKSVPEAPRQLYPERTKKDITISRLSLIKTAAELISAMVGKVESRLNLR